jgi:L-alanine-DL-glutamate epimerase-like enolase superfamily enzyme
VLGHKAIREALKPYGIGVATGEMCQNRVMFKQFLAAGAIDVCQIDACRLGGVNEVIAVLLMAAKVLPSASFTSNRTDDSLVQRPHRPPQWRCGSP